LFLIYNQKYYYTIAFNKLDQFFAVLAQLYNVYMNKHEAKVNAVC